MSGSFGIDRSDTLHAGVSEELADDWELAELGFEEVQEDPDGRRELVCWSFPSAVNQWGVAICPVGLASILGRDKEIAEVIIG